ncbi:MAG: hypothetical protein AB7O56_08015 [Bauldia sp.]
MTERFGAWEPMDTAPRDGRRILAVVRTSEQWPAEVELVRWARPKHQAEHCWVAADSGPNSATIFAEQELAFWMPLPEAPEGV